MNKLEVFTRNKEHKMYEVLKKDAVSYKSARALLSLALDNESLFDQILESYWDYKNKVSYWNLRSVSKPSFDYILNHEIRSSLNRLSFNLLNLGKMYLDTHFNNKKKQCFASSISGNQDYFLAVEQHREEIYKSNVGYVVGCHLRGFSQHSQLPVNSFRTGVRYDAGRNQRQVSFDIVYKYADLVDIGVPKKLISKNTTMELTDILDNYVYAISRKHQLNRKLTSCHIENAKRLLSEIWFDKIGESSEYFEARLLCSGDEYNLDLSWLEVYEYLIKKHSQPIKYSALSFEK